MRNNNIKKKQITISKSSVERKVQSLGPVENLEQYVRQDWWRRIFNSLYLKTDGDVVNDNNITVQEINLFSQFLQLKKEDQILDLCCGQGRHSLELARRGFMHIFGLDRSSFLIRSARETSKKENLTAKFREGDARRLPYPSDFFDVVMILGNSFGYFESITDDLKILKEVFRVLKPWGRIILDVADGDFLKQNFKKRSWEWIDKEYFVCRERELSFDQQRLISREIISHTTKGVVADQFYAERLYDQSKLSELLETSGYADVELQSELYPDSRRNQDLGMMERRLVFTAVVKKEWSPTKLKINGKLQNVVVLMGDPQRNDKVKPGAVFDEDDMYTIDQLKMALKENGDYNFVYLTNHNNFIPELLKLKDKISFVFNLCDEGYFNDPRKELHVPALLEMLEIPYSGSGPQCLAYCYDKSLVRGIAKELNIPVPEGIYINKDDTIFDLHFKFPVICKPNFGDSSFGITQNSVAYAGEQLIKAISEIRDSFGYNYPILIEELLTGADLSVGIIGNPPDAYHILPITEEDYSAIPEKLPKICGYEAKWQPESIYWNIKSVPAHLHNETREFIIDCCLRLYERLECRDYCRFDWRLDANGNPKLLEVNPNPGWCWDGHLAKMANHEGKSYSQLLEAIFDAVEKRLEIKPLNGNSD